MTDKSDTPRVDALGKNERHRNFEEIRYWTDQYRILARTLERELNDARAKLCCRDNEYLDRALIAEAKLASANAKLTTKQDVAGLVESIQSLRATRHEWDGAAASELLLLDEAVDALLSLSAQLANCEARASELHENGIRLMEAADGWKTRCDAETLIRQRVENELKIQDDANEILTRQLQEKGAECEAYRKDAERYKWLASRVLACDYGDNDADGEQIGWGVRYDLLPKTIGQGKPAFMYGESIDAAIDAARLDACAVDS